LNKTILGQYIPHNQKKASRSSKNRSYHILNQTWGNACNKTTEPVYCDAQHTLPDYDQPKDTFDFIISHIETLDHLFIQLLSQEKEIVNLNLSLQNQYRQLSGKRDTAWKTNQLCLTKSVDNYWYRGRMI
jgi:Tudor domain